MTPRSVLITGASSGLGRGLSLHYARAGATVHAVARRKPELQALAAEAPEGRVVPVVLDVTDTERLVEAIHGAEASSGGALDPGFVKTELTAKNKFPMPFLMELEDAVRVMVRGIARGKATIAYPLPMAALVRSIAALPRSLYEPLAARSRTF